MQGWVSFHRKISEWEWYNDANTFRLFFHLVLMANHQPTKWQGINIERGQHITSPNKLASQLKLTDSKIRTSLKKLKSTGEITIKTTNKFTLVTVANYDFYQDEGREVTSKTTIKSQSNHKQITTNNNENNERMKEYTTDVKLLESLIDFETMRNKIKKPMTIRALNGIIKKLEKHDVEMQIAMLEQSIEKCYTGVFEINNNYNTNKKEGDDYYSRTY